MPGIGLNSPVTRQVRKQASCRPDIHCVCNRRSDHERVRACWSTQQRDHQGECFVAELFCFQPRTRGLCDAGG